MLKARVPRSITEWLFSLIDFNIHPLVIGRYLELIIVLHSLWLRVQEYFDDVAIPKLPTLDRRVLPFIDIQSNSTDSARFHKVLERSPSGATSTGDRFIVSCTSLV